MDVKVFISWSKEPSRTIAKSLAGWLGGLVQAAEPWMSDEDIGSGRRWRDLLAAALNETDFGIVCLTSANQTEPWLMFEAGALAKNLESARVIPLCIDLEPSEIDTPLADWQARRLNETEMWKVVQDINASTPRPVALSSLRSLFELTWPAFERDVNEAKASAARPDLVKARRDPQDMLEELVQRVRRLDRPEAGLRDLANLNRLLLVQTSDVGRPKSQVLADLVERSDQIEADLKRRNIFVDESIFPHPPAYRPEPKEDKPPTSEERDNEK
jgi:hypothetical protein